MSNLSFLSVFMVQWRQPSVVRRMSAISGLISWLVTVGVWTGEIQPLADLRPVMPAHGTASIEPARSWEFAMVTGNGRLGAMLFGDPSQERFIANYCRLYRPLGSREIVPELAPYLPELRRIIRTKGYRQAMDFFLRKAKEQGFPGLIWTDPYHPGFEIHIRQAIVGAVHDYVRTEDFATGEVTVQWRDDRGKFRRRLLVSRLDNVIVLRLEGPERVGLSCELRFPPVGHPDIASHQQVSSEWVTYHNTYTKGKGGYDAAVRIVAHGGHVRQQGRTLQVEGAEAVTLLMRLVPWKTPLPPEQSQAWAYSPAHPDFAPYRLGRYEPVPPLADSSVVAYLRQEDSEALLPQIQAALARVPTDYDQLFAPHARAHRALFERVQIHLGAGVDRWLSSEALLDRAAKTGRLSMALLEKMYEAGRYMFICSAGELPPNLQGIWTGTWKPAWSGDFTTDTNVELAMKQVFSGNLIELARGYFRLIEAALMDWRLNARSYYGCGGVLAPPRMSNNGLMLH